MIVIKLCARVVLFAAVEGNEQNAAQRWIFCQRSRDFNHHRHARRIVHRTSELPAKSVVVGADDNEFVFARVAFNEADDILSTTGNRLKQVIFAGGRFQSGFTKLCGQVARRLSSAITFESPAREFSGCQPLRNGLEIGIGDRLYDRLC